MIHGTADVLVPVECGVDTADNIKNSQLKLIEGMGHDLPNELVSEIVDLISQHINSVSQP